MHRLTIVESLFEEFPNANQDKVTSDLFIKRLEESLDIKLSEEESRRLSSATFTETLSVLIEWLGPEEPIDGVLTLTDEQFIRRYKPETTPQGGYYRQREWYDHEDAAELKLAVSENRCWSMVDDDDGNLCIDWGNRVVNRIFNIITMRPIENPEWIVQVPYEDEDMDSEEEENV